MKKIIPSISFLLCFCLIFGLCGCKNSGDGNKTPVADVLGGKANTSNLVTGGSTLRRRSDFKVPDNLMTTDEYHAEMDSLLKQGKNFSDITDDFQEKIDNLDLRLQDQIIYNTDDITECEGMHFYISADGDDDNDGTSPETPWKTINKLNSEELCEGDLVSFRRGDKFHGVIAVKSGVTYGAYGEGYKPQICASFDAKQWQWLKTDYENVWMLDHRFGNKDKSAFASNAPEKLIEDLAVSVLVKQDGTEASGTRYVWLNTMKNNGNFCYTGLAYDRGHTEDDGPNIRQNRIYLYCDEGNPNDVYSDIEIGVNLSVFNENNKYIEDVHLNNLELLYGKGPFWPGDCKNISVTYCIAGWQGGYDDGSQSVPFGGGGGVWGNCDNFLWDHCYIFQQWDSGVSPQFNGSSNPVVNFKDFITTNCIFKGCKWTFEYWLYQKLTTQDKIDHLVFDYNLCRDGGWGFNNYMRSESAYVMTWGYESSCYNSSISHNLFDRPFAKTYEIGGFEQLEAGTETKSPVDKFSLERMPKMEGNIHIQVPKKKFALVHKGCEYKESGHDLVFKYTKDDLQKFIDSGFEKNSLFLFSQKKEDEK